MGRNTFPFFLLLLLCNLSASGAEYIFDFNPNCREAYKQLMSLQAEQASLTLKTELRKQPDNFIPLYLADYSDCLRLLFNGNAADYEPFKTNQESRLDKIENADEKSPWYLFCKANIQLHGALVAMRFGDNYKAANKFRKSYALLKENKAEFPDFEENKILLGLEQAVAGAIPDNYKWIGAIFGVKGNINQGVGEIASYLNDNPDGNGIMQEEAMIYYAYLKFYLLSAQESAWKYINGPQYNENNNLMRSFVKANLALNYRKADVALNILNNAVKLKEYELFPIMHYEHAEAMLYQMDLNSLVHYKQFLKAYKGQHFVKDTWLKMAWIAYLQKDKTQQSVCMEKIKAEGNTSTDADKQALRMAENPTWPQNPLLEVRLLIDGGAYKKALSIIQGIDKQQLNSVVNKLDYNFRYGRIFEELGQNEKAILFYTATINMGRERKEHYAARAALQKAFIYERQGKKTEAIAQFNDCLSMRNHDFQSSIDQLAKAGLNRLGK